MKIESQSQKVLSRLQSGHFSAANYPEGAGYKEKGGTSEEAARNTDAATLRGMTLAELKRSPGTADEIANRLEIDRLSIRPRLSELKNKGLIRKTDFTRPNDSGKNARVWEAVA